MHIVFFPGFAGVFTRVFKQEFIKFPARGQGIKNLAYWVICFAGVFEAKDSLTN